MNPKEWKTAPLPPKKPPRNFLTHPKSNRGRKPKGYEYPPLNNDIPYEIASKEPKYNKVVNDKIIPHLDLITNLVIEGHTSKDIAEAIGMSVHQFYDYSSKLEILKNALAFARNVRKMVRNENVDNSLYKSAMGYEYKEKTVSDNEVNGVTVTESTKFAKPVSTAQIFYLKNHMPEQYADKKKLEISRSLEDFFNEED